LFVISYPLLEETNAASAPLVTFNDGSSVSVKLENEEEEAKPLSTKLSIMRKKKNTFLLNNPVTEHSIVLPNIMSRNTIVREKKPSLADTATSVSGMLVFAEQHDTLHDDDAMVVTQKYQLSKSKKKTLYATKAPLAQLAPAPPSMTAGTEHEFNLFAAESSVKPFKPLRTAPEFNSLPDSLSMLLPDVALMSALEYQQDFVVAPASSAIPQVQVEPIVAKIENQPVVPTTINALPVIAHHVEPMPIVNVSPTVALVVEQQTAPQVPLTRMIEAPVQHLSNDMSHDICNFDRRNLRPVNKTTNPATKPPKQAKPLPVVVEKPISTTTTETTETTGHMDLIAARMLEIREAVADDSDTDDGSIFE